MKYKINYDINNLKYSNTQGEVGVEFNEHIKYLYRLQSNSQIKEQVSLISNNEPNDSIETINEIKELLKKQENRDQKLLDQILDEAYGDGMYNIFKKYMIKGKLDNNFIDKQLDKIDKYLHKDEIELSILSNKKYYDRVRPSILSEELYSLGIIDKILKPWIEIPTHPAYPSGHATQSMYIATILTHFDPDNKELYEQAAEEISTNREIAGLHYRSDSLAGYELGIKLAYKLINSDFK